MKTDSTIMRIIASIRTWSGSLTWLGQLLAQTATGGSRHVGFPARRPSSIGRNYLLNPLDFALALPIGFRAEASSALLAHALSDTLAAKLTMRKKP